MNTQNTLLRMVRSARKALQMDRDMRSAGYSNNPFADILGDIADAIYYMIGEEAETFDESVTWLALKLEGVPDEHRVMLLQSVMARNELEDPVTFA